MSEKGFIHLLKKTTENAKENEQFVGTSLVREKKSTTLCFSYVNHQPLDLETSDHYTEFSSLRSSSDAEH